MALRESLLCKGILSALMTLGLLLAAGVCAAETPVPAKISVTDALGNPVTVTNAQHVICSGSGCLRLLVYLQAQDRIVAVDDIETRRRSFDARPYALANPQFKTMPIFGEFRGHDNPELILGLHPQPQIIFKTNPAAGYDAGELQQKTGITVVPLDYGNLTDKRQALYTSLRIMGEVLGKQQRAEEVIAFFEDQIAQLAKRCEGINTADAPSVFLGGVAFKGPHGFQSTEPAYPPFMFVKTRNLALESGKVNSTTMQNANISKEMIVVWNPDYLFLDLATLQLGEETSGLHELQTDPAYATLQAVKRGAAYGVLPYNWYTQNFGSILANAWYTGTLLYPDAFAGVDPAVQADRIYTFLVGKPVFAEMNAMFGGLAFSPLPLR